MDLTLLKLCLFLFGGAGVNPQKGYSPIQVSLYIMTTVFHWSIIYLAILYFVYNDDYKITEMTGIFQTCFLLFHGSVKLTLLFVKETKVNDLLERINYFWKIENIEDEAEKKEYTSYMTFIRNIYFTYHFFCCSTTIIFIGTPFILQGDIFTTYKPDWIPFYGMVIYESAVFIFGVYCAIAGFDSFMIVLLLSIKLQFKLLNQEIGRVFQEMTNPTENIKRFDMKIKKIVDYHNFLLDYVKRVNNVLSEGMLVYIITIVLSMCMEMYVTLTEKSLKSSIKSIIYMVNGLVQFSVCYCLPVQAITDEAEKTLEYLYCSKWYENLTPTGKVAQTMIMGRAQKKILVVAGGFIKINLETCLNTIKTMVSYAMFLRTMGTEKN